MKSQHNVVATWVRTFTVALTVAVALLFTLTPGKAYAARIFLDPGHGGYPGAVYAGVEEQYVNLLLALEARSVLISRGHEVAMSRTTDAKVCSTDIATWHWDETTQQYYLYRDGKTGIYALTPGADAIPYDDLQMRSDMANAWESDVFLSIHNNAGGGTGTETYYNSWNTVTDTGPSKTLATYIQQDIVASAGTYDRKVDDVGYYVIRWANMPAALVEVGFLDNPTERALLLSTSFRHKVAIGIANAIDRYLAADLIQPIEPRIAGATRYDTAVAAAAAGWPDGSDTVLLASGENWPDSLTAGPLSYKLDAPLFLTRESSLPTSVAEAISASGASNIIILGGTGAVSSDVATAAALAASIEASEVVRIAGADRYETAALIAEEVGLVPGAGVTLVSGQTFVDAVSASSFSSTRGMPILLTSGPELSLEVSAFMEAHSDEATRAVIVGGTGAVSGIAGDALAEYAYVERIAGIDRYATNIAVVERFWPEGDIRPYAATSRDFPDALTAGCLAAKNGEPVVLFGRRYLDKTTRQFIMHENSRLYGWTMFGGSGALDYLLEWELAKARRLPPPIAP